MSSKKTSFDDDFEAFLKGGDADLSVLYAKLPQAEPDAKLDAAVLAMAHRALNAHLVATPGRSTRPSNARRRAHWLPALSVAATAVFAIGVAVKMGPQWAERGAQAPAASSAPAERDNGVVYVRPIDAPAAPPPPASPPPPPSMSYGAPKQEATRAAPKPAAAPPPPAPPIQKSAPAAEAPALRAETELASKEFEKVENVAAPAAAPAAAPEPFPGQPTRQAEMDSVERKQAIAEGAWQRLHDADGLGAAASGSLAKPAAQAPQTTTAPRPPAAKLEEQRAAAPAGGRAGGFAQQAPAPAPTQAAPVQAAPAKAAATTAGVDSNTEREKLDTVTVTGSSIRRVDVQTASPAVTVDRASLQDEKPADDKTKRGAGIGLKRGYSAEVLRNSRLYPEAWMAAIQRLIRAERRDEARQNLELFSVKYPKYHLPDEVERFARDVR